MQQWFYLDDSGSQIEVSENELTTLVEDGTITPETHVWYEGLDTWHPCQDILPQLFGLEEAEPVEFDESGEVENRLLVGPDADAAQQGKKLITNVQRKIQGSTGTGDIVDHSNLIRRLAAPLYQARGWMKLVGVALIIVGIPYILALGLGIIMIIMGVYLFQAAGAGQRATVSGQLHDLDEAQRKLKTFFTMFGVCTLISMIGAILLSVVYAGILMAVLANFKEMKETAGSGINDPSVIDFQEMEDASAREEVEEDSGMVEIEPEMDLEPLEEETVPNPFDFETEEE